MSFQEMSAKTMNRTLEMIKNRTGPPILDPTASRCYDQGIGHAQKLLEQLNSFYHSVEQEQSIPDQISFPVLHGNRRTNQIEEGVLNIDLTNLGEVQFMLNVTKVLEHGVISSKDPARLPTFLNWLSKLDEGGQR